MTWKYRTRNWKLRGVEAGGFDTIRLVLNQAIIKNLKYFSILEIKSFIFLLKGWLSSSSNSKITNYIIPSNSVSLSSTTDTSNINFSLEINEYQLDSSFTGTLFATYYENYIAEIFNTKRRLIRVTAYLPLNMIYNLELNEY